MSFIRIVCISDTHGQHSRLRVPKGDILIHAGDFMAFGDSPKEVTDFNRWVGQQMHRHKVVIAGNHDWLFERHPGAARALLTNAIYLENSGTELDGLKFWGSPVQPAFNNWAFNVNRGVAIRLYWKMIPEGTDILVTHVQSCSTIRSLSCQSFQPALPSQVTWELAWKPRSRANCARSGLRHSSIRNFSTPHTPREELRSRIFVTEILVAPGMESRRGRPRCGAALA
jgi:hypothetical protein